MPAYPIALQFGDDEVVLDALNESFLNQHRICHNHTIRHFVHHVEIETEAWLAVKRFSRMYASMHNSTTCSLDTLRRSLIQIGVIAIISAWVCAITLRRRIYCSLLEHSDMEADFVKRGIVLMRARAHAHSAAQIAINLICRIMLEIEAVCDVLLSPVVSVPVYFEEIECESSARGTFYLRRRIRALCEAMSDAPIGDFRRTRSLYSDIECTSEYYWENAYLYLIRRIYPDYQLKLDVELKHTFMFKEGNPAIRVEPPVWYKRRIAPGDIVILENPWI